MTETSEIWTGKASSYNRVRPMPPPAIHWKLDQLAQEGSLRVVKLIQERGLAQSFKIWPKRPPAREHSLPLHPRGVAPSY